METLHGEAVASYISHELTIAQSSDKAILHWKDFSIQRGEITRFLQPSKDSAVLNRVTGTLPSSIHGLLQANGKVYLINPQGIIVGPEGRIKTNGFVASCLDLANEEFLAQSTICFKGDSEKAVVHLGIIEAIEGDVFLIAREVANLGAIDGKTVGLAGASEILLAPDGNQRIYIHPLSSGRVDNEGSIQALQAELRAAGGSAYSLAINHEGIIEVDGLNAEIALHAEKDWVEVSGSLSSRGGEIHVLGEHIHLLESCKIDASGTSGGGEILIGGDYQGQHSKIPLAISTYVGLDVTIYSDALEQGNGGQIIIWGEDVCQVYGSIFARGGPSDGDGGFVEISGHGLYDYQGKVNTLAPYGKTGMFLMDPSDITISTAASSPSFPTSPGTYNPPGASGTLNNGNLQTGLASSNVTVTTSGGTGGTGNITWSAGAPISWSAATTLILIADRSISLNSNITNTATGSFTAMNFTANSGGATAGNFDGINVAGPTISSAEGAIIMNGTAGNGSTNGNIGVLINTGAIIQSTGSGAAAATISITGVGGAGPCANNFGVQVDGAGTAITSINGTINVTGTSGATSGAGNTNNHGIYLSAGGKISSTGPTGGAAITLNGTGAPAQSSNNGVYISGTSSLVSSVSGNIDIIGVGGAAATTNNTGVQIDSAGAVSSTGTGANAALITINGTGGAGTGTNDGIFITGANSKVTTADGSITLIGTGAGTGTNNRGIHLATAAAIQYDGSSAGTISLTGTGSGTSGTGVFFTGTSSGITATTSSPKDIYILGTDSSDVGINVASSIGNANTTGNITLETDIITTTGASIQTTGNILLEQKIPSTSIGLAGGAGTFNLTTGQLNAIQPGAARLTIGRSNGASTMTVRAYTFNTNVVLQDSAMVISTGPVTTSAGDSMTLTADTMTISNAVTGTGTLTIQPLTASTSIGLADGAAGTLNLTTSALNNLGTAFSSITFGQALQTGAVDMQAYTYSTPIIVNGSTIGVNGAIIAGTKNVTLNIGPAGTGILNLSNTVTTSGTFQVNGGSNNDAFNIITTSAQTASLNGNGGTNTLTGPNTTNTWVITGSNNAGTLNTTIAFSNMENLVGGTGTDSFTFNGAFQLTGTTGINGGTGNNSVTGPNVANAWTITADNTGSINPTGASGATLFTNIQSLVGGTGADAFTFNGAFQLSGATGINGGTGSNTITGPSGVANAWTISSADGGSLNPTGATGSTVFANVGNLIGGPLSANTFTLNAGGTLSGAINGTTSSGNALAYAAGYGAVNIALTSSAANGTATGITGGFSNIQSFTGSSSASNTLTGPNTANTWVITGSNNAGTLNTTIAFSNMKNLVGGTGTDSFTFNGAFQLTGTTGIDGGTGNNSVTGPNVTNAWTITANNTGSIDPTGASGATLFTNIQSLVGGTGTDTFTFNGAFQLSGATGIDGGTGSNTITSPSGLANAWTISSADGGSLNPTGAAGATVFANIGNLVGGALSANTFTFNAGGTLSGALNGTTSTGNALAYAAGYGVVNIILTSNAANGTATGIGGGFSNIQSFIGSSSGSNTLAGPNTANTWVITGSNNAGTLNTAIAFSNMENLAGGTGTDSFTFNGAFQLTGTSGIDGGPGNNSVIGPNVTNAWTITANNTGSIDPTGASGATLFTNIQNLVGGTGTDTFTFNGAFQLSGATGIDGGTGSNTITGPSGVANAWTISSSDGGSLNPTGAAGATIFANIGNLVGGALSANTFTLNAGGTLSGAINGTTSSGNALAYAAGYGIVNIGLTSNAANGTATGITGGFSNVQSFTGSSSASNTLTGSNGTNSWIITGSNLGVLNETIAFSNFSNLTGGSGNDTFDFSAGFTITGIVDGGAGSNTLNASNSNNLWNITNTDQGNVAGISFVNIGNVVGGNKIDIFSFADQKGLTGIVNGGSGSGVNTLDYTLFTIPAHVYPITISSGTASNLGIGYVNVTNFVGNVIVSPIPPSIIFSTAMIQNATIQTQITIIGTDSFLFTGDTLDSIAYGSYGAPLDEVFVLSRILKKVEIIQQGIQLKKTATYIERDSKIGL